MCASAEFLMSRGARRVWAMCTHPVFSGNAIERLRRSAIEKIIVSNSLPISESKRLDNLTVLSVAPILADAMRHFWG